MTVFFLATDLIIILREFKACVKGFYCTGVNDLVVIFCSYILKV